MADVFNDLQGLLGITGFLIVVATGRLRFALGLVTVGSLSGLVGDVLSTHAWTPVDAALAVYYGWWWWRSGGGDGTKRRLRKWARRFRGVRRTAPVMGAA